jgi:N-acetyl-gamma-glutamyl-phosphate reductase
LPELNKANIRNAYIANPGCLPLRYNWFYYRLQQRIIKDRCPYQCYNGKYCAGVSPSETTHFSWRSNNMSHYKAFDHQHLGEINQSVNQLQADYTNELIFVPNRDFAQNFCHFIYDNRGKPRRHLAKYEAFIKISLL